ncbi:unnamed protein product [Nyctereutes procyonoides]|uniref:(raccoon dog) hypothetical protein n=1 Tax=Nyctereutes procyonoides TaxID=34880 RepID=A0A811Y9J9_NYCPR|nr:unnamed protein product [Nyctereutes procyonoides]
MSKDQGTPRRIQTNSSSWFTRTYLGWGWWVIFWPLYPLSDSLGPLGPFTQYLSWLTHVGKSLDTMVLCMVASLSILISYRLKHQNQRRYPKPFSTF